jgi:ketosteroid isomerase-like protein
LLIGALSPPDAARGDHDSTREEHEHDQRYGDDPTHKHDHLMALDNEPVSANLDLVRSIYANWERGDYRSVEWAHPDIEYVMVEGTHAGKWTGTAAMAEVWREWLGAWGRFKSEAEALRELSDGRVLVLVRGHGRSKTSTVEVVDRSANVFDIRGGRVTRLTIYNSRDRAFADLGLEG